MLFISIAGDDKQEPFKDKAMLTNQVCCSY